MPACASFVDDELRSILTRVYSKVTILCSQQPNKHIFFVFSELIISPHLHLWSLSLRPTCERERATASTASSCVWLEDVRGDIADIVAAIGVAVACPLVHLQILYGPISPQLFWPLAAKHGFRGWRRTSAAWCRRWRTRCGRSWWGCDRTRSPSTSGRRRHKMRWALHGNEDFWSLLFILFFSFFLLLYTREVFLVQAR